MINITKRKHKNTQDFNDWINFLQIIRIGNNIVKMVCSSPYFVCQQ